MFELFQKSIQIISQTTDWFNNHILSGLIDFLKALGEVIIKIFEFLIEAIKWIIGKI